MCRQVLMGTEGKRGRAGEVPPGMHGGLSPRLC